MCIKNYDQMIPAIWCATDGWRDRETDRRTDARRDGWRGARTGGQTDRRTDGRMEKVTYRGGCPN